jgi:RimJ/RimL family protein N-acetyltransferase
MVTSSCHVLLRHGEMATLRSALPPDAVHISRLRRSIAVESAWTIDAPDEVASPSRIESLIEKRTESPSLWVIAEVGGRLVGEVTLRVDRRARVNHVGHLSLMVAADTRGRGLGWALLSRAIEHATEHPQIHKISLAVIADHERALSLYRRARFREEGRRTGQVRLAPQQYADDIVMALWVKANQPTSGDTR